MKNRRISYIISNFRILFTVDDQILHCLNHSTMCVSVKKKRIQHSLKVVFSSGKIQYLDKDEPIREYYIDLVLTNGGIESVLVDAFAKSPSVSAIRIYQCLLFR